MDSSVSLTAEDKQAWKDLFGPGSLREDLRKSTVDQIVENITPRLTKERLRIGQLIPFLEKRNVFGPDTLANLNEAEQVEFLCSYISGDPTPHNIFCLYASLMESGEKLPLHYQLASDIKSIVQLECEKDDSVSGLQDKRGLFHSQPTPLDTRSPNNTQEMTGQKSGLFCVVPCDATHTGDKGPPNPSGDKSLTSASRETTRHLTDVFTTSSSSSQGSGPQELVPGSVPRHGSLSSSDSASSSLKNSLSSVMENSLDSVAPPLSQANDFGSSSASYQNEFGGPSAATGPIELCDPFLLAEFNNLSESDVFAVLVQTGANINLPTNHERSYLLHLAIDGVMVDKVQMLLQNGVDVNVVRADGRTPLHLACEKQLIEFVRLLVDHGANVNAEDNSGMTCLHLMNTLQEPDIVEYLIRCGAKFDPPTKDRFNTPLAIATGLSSDTVLRTVSLLLQAGALVNGRPESAVRPLVAAASTGHFDSVELLLSSGAAVNLTNKDGTTALMAAVTGNHQNIVQLLLDKGADLSHIRSGPYTISGNMVLMSSTALSDAAHLGHLPLVKLLKERGAKLTAMSPQENAPIVFAAMGGNAEVVDYIISNGELSENELLDAFVAALKLCHDRCAVALLKRSTRQDVLMDTAAQYCTGERLDKLFKMYRGEAGQEASSPAQTSGPDAHVPSLTEAPQRATLPGTTPSIVGIDDLFHPVQAFPPARQLPSRSSSTRHSTDDDHILMSQGLGQEAHRRRLIEILHEFAQVCMQAALNNKTCEWLTDHARRCHHPRLAEFFTAYTHGVASSDPGTLMDDFFSGDPSVLNFLIQRSIISKSRVQKVLNDMGRNDVEFFTELMEAFHHFPGTDHLPYDGDLLVTHLFEGTIIMGQRYRPSSEPFSSETSERQPTIPTSGGHRLGGNIPPTNMRDLYGQQSTQQSRQQASQQTSQQAGQQNNQLTSQQTSQQANQQQASQQTSQLANQQFSQQASQQNTQQASQQANSPAGQRGDQFSTQQQLLQSQPKLQHQQSSSSGEIPGVNGSRVPVGSPSLRYGSSGQSTGSSSGSSPPNSFNEDLSSGAAPDYSNRFSDRIDILNDFNTLGNNSPHNQTVRSQLNFTQSLRMGNEYNSKANPVALNSTSTAIRTDSSISQSSQPPMANTSKVVEPPSIQQSYQEKSELKSQSESLSLQRDELSQSPRSESVSQTHIQQLHVSNETLSQPHTPSNDQVLSRTQLPRNESLSLTPSEPLPLKQPLKNDPEKTVSTGDEGKPEMIASRTFTAPSEHSVVLSSKSKTTGTKDKASLHAADGKQKQDRPKPSPSSTMTRPKDELSRVGKNVPKPATQHWSSHRPQQATSASSATLKPLKLKGTTVATTPETKTRGKGTNGKPTTNTTVSTEENSNDWGEEKVGEVERKGQDYVRNKKMEDIINEHRSGIDSKEEDLSDVPTNVERQYQVEHCTGSLSLPGSTNNEALRFFIVDIDSAHLDELITRFESARIQCKCTHAQVTLKYRDTKDSPGPLSNNTFFAPLSQCHTIICALCSYKKCSSVLVTANMSEFS